RRYDLEGHYNDSYRVLFNDVIESASRRFVSSSSLDPPRAQIGASKWSVEEKALFFAALDRLGRDNTPGIAQAIGSKSVAEVQELILVLQDAASSHGNTKVTLRDVEAAFELSHTCSERLELAGEALAWYQERFEAKEEQDRYGDYWLITPEIAEQLEDAVRAAAVPSASSSPLPEGGNSRGKRPAADPIEIPSILRDIPEGRLLCLQTMLDLSSSLFMNSSPTLDFPFPHWSTLVSPFAQSPSMFRTAVNDLHTLVVSITRRLVQATVIQATSRIRANDWRTKKGVFPLVQPRDVVTAVDILGLPRNGRERWKGVARRCGLRVRDGKMRRHEGRDLDWDEVEEALSSTGGTKSIDESGDDTPGSSSTGGAFQDRAARSGTPLPVGRFLTSESDDDGPDQNSDAGASSADESSASSSSLSSLASNVGKRSDQSAEGNENVAQTLEDFDMQASRAEESHLWNLLGTPPPNSTLLKHEEEQEVADPAGETLGMPKDDWRAWTEYKAEWEMFDTPVPIANFRANQSTKHPTMAELTRGIKRASTSGNESMVESGRARRKRQKRTQAELPIRGARAYAALQ
ncbi:hypothetical protein EJ04DRAFT_408586, partial [Polyplosphaeria fusca]